MSADNPEVAAFILTPPLASREQRTAGNGWGLRIADLGQTPVVLGALDEQPYIREPTSPEGWMRLARGRRGILLVATEDPDRQNFVPPDNQIVSQIGDAVRAYIKVDVLANSVREIAAWRVGIGTKIVLGGLSNLRDASYIGHVEFIGHGEAAAQRIESQLEALKGVQG